MSNCFNSASVKPTPAELKSAIFFFTFLHFSSTSVVGLFIISSVNNVSCILSSSNSFVSPPKSALTFNLSSRVISFLAPVMIYFKLSFVLLIRTAESRSSTSTPTCVNQSPVFCKDFKIGCITFQILIIPSLSNISSRSFVFPWQ